MPALFARFLAWPYTPPPAQHCHCKDRSNNTWNTFLPIARPSQRLAPPDSVVNGRLVHGVDSETAAVPIAARRRAVSLSAPLGLAGPLSRENRLNAQRPAEQADANDQPDGDGTDALAQLGAAIRRIAEPLSKNGIPFVHRSSIDAPKCGSARLAKNDTRIRCCSRVLPRPAWLLQRNPPSAVRLIAAATCAAVDLNMLQLLGKSDRRPGSQIVSSPRRCSDIRL